MTEQTGGAPGAAPGGTPAGSNNNAAPARVGMPAQAAAQRERNNDNPRAKGFSPAADERAQTQQTAPGERMIEIGENSFTEREVSDAIARDAEQQMRRNTLPKTEAEYQARNSQDFQLPEGVKFEFNQNDPLLAQARKFALSRGMSQEDFSALLDLHVAGKTGELMAQAQAREVNLKELGAAGPARIQAVAQWLNARAGKDGAAVASFIKQYPSAPIVRAFENVIRQFSNQGGVDFSQSHRAQQEDTGGKIAGYENMNFAQRRAAQMARQFGPQKSER